MNFGGVGTFREPRDAATVREIARLLANRYGDGVVYLPRDLPRTLLDLAVNMGFVSEEGYVTRKGRSLLASAEGA